MTGLIQYDYGYGYYLAYEILVFVLEAMVIRLVVGCPTPRAFRTSFVANSLSIVVGLVPGVVAQYLLGMIVEVLVALYLLRKWKPERVLTSVVDVNVVTMWLVPLNLPYVLGTPSSQQSHCFRNLKVIGKAILDYRAANNGLVPDAKDIEELKVHLAPYLRQGKEVFECPAWHGHRDTPDYVLKRPLSGKLGKPLEDNPSNTIIVADSFPRHQGGVNVLYLDGLVKWKAAATSH